MPKSNPNKASLLKVRAFSEMLADDISDAINNGIEPGEAVCALLLYASTLAISNAKMDAEEFIQYAVTCWNDRAEKLSDDPYYLSVYEDGEGPSN